jgi:hypothetical protein
MSRNMAGSVSNAFLRLPDSHNRADLNNEQYSNVILQVYTQLET